MRRRVCVWGLRLLVGLVVGKTVQAQESATVQVTYYVDSGTTYSGTRTRPGVAACSWNWAIGTRFRFADGREVVCEDRGHLGSAGWIDVWMPSRAEGRAQIAAAYGSLATVEVLR